MKQSCFCAPTGQLLKRCASSPHPPRTGSPGAPPASPSLASAKKPEGTCPRWGRNLAASCVAPIGGTGLLTAHKPEPRVYTLGPNTPARWSQSANSSPMGRAATGHAAGLGGGGGCALEHNGLQIGNYPLGLLTSEKVAWWPLSLVVDHLACGSAFGPLTHSREWGWTRTRLGSCPKQHEGGARSPPRPLTSSSL